MLERFMAKRIPIWGTLLAMLLMLLFVILFGAIVVDALVGGSRLGFISKVAVEVASIPQTVARGLRPDERMNVPGILPKLPDGLWMNPKDDFNDDGYLLVSRYREDLNRFVVELVSLSNGKVLHRYAPDVGAIHARSKMVSPLVDLMRDRGPSIYIMYHPMLTPAGGLISHHVSPLVSIDRCSNIEWTIDGIFHHAIERGGDGNYWVGYTYPKARQPNVSPKYDDQALAQVSPSGKILQLIPLRKILDGNNLQGLLDSRSYTDDPYHLNDIEPALTNSKFWRAGDLFLSFRHFSGLMLYRPSTGKVLWSRQGITYAQHDIQILDNHRIAIFDNNARPTWPRIKVAGHNRTTVYDFATDEISHPFDAALAKERVATATQGRQMIQANGDVVIEETEYGRILRLAPDGTLRWRYISARADGRRTVLGWSRYLERERWGDSVENAVKGNCT